MTIKQQNALIKEFPQKGMRFLRRKSGSNDYKDLPRLRKFITEKGKILPAYERRLRHSPERACRSD
jgi:ribosomal protein S18